MFFFRSFVPQQCWPRSGQNGTTAHDRPRTTTHDQPRTHDRPRTTDHACHICLRKRYPPHPTPGGFRGLNCLARLALARERTPSRSKTDHTMSLVPPTNTNDHVLSLQSRPKIKLIPMLHQIKSDIFEHCISHTQ